MSAAVQGYLTVDLNVYVSLLYFFGLVMFGCGRICEYLWGLLETYCSKNSLYPNKRTRFLIISSFNCSSSNDSHTSVLADCSSITLITHGVNVGKPTHDG